MVNNLEGIDGMDGIEGIDSTIPRSPPSPLSPLSPLSHLFSRQPLHILRPQSHPAADPDSEQDGSPRADEWQQPHHRRRDDRRGGARDHRRNRVLNDVHKPQLRASVLPDLEMSRDHDNASRREHDELEHGFTTYMAGCIRLGLDYG